MKNIGKKRWSSSIFDYYSKNINEDAFLRFPSDREHFLPQSKEFRSSDEHFVEKMTKFLSLNLKNRHCQAKFEIKNAFCF
jgi:hypothetical protein